ncbi:MAG: hypothetical protein PF961_11100 [Planctomycetota bacterium]|jgi:galactonate dehydratase|nr:hypothetical protein [Planctomycetota bacterium]
MAKDVPWRAEICDEDIVIENGAMLINERPGLGVTLNHAEMERHPYREHDLRHYTGSLTAIHPDAADSWFSPGTAVC